MKGSRTALRFDYGWLAGVGPLLLGGALVACGGGGDDSEPSLIIEGTVQASIEADGGAPGEFRFEGARPQEALAEFLGISVAQLEADLQTPGATQAGVAALYGKTREELKQFLIEQNRETLDGAVEAGSMDEATADSLHEAFANGIEESLDAQGGGFGGPILSGPGRAGGPGGGSQQGNP